MVPQIVAVPHNTRLQHTTNPTLLWSKRLTKEGFTTGTRIPADEPLEASARS